MRCHFVVGLLVGFVSGQATLSKSTSGVTSLYADVIYQPLFQARQSQQRRRILTLAGRSSQRFRIPTHTHTPHPRLCGKRQPFQLLHPYRLARTRSVQLKTNTVVSMLKVLFMECYVIRCSVALS